MPRVSILVGIHHCMKPQGEGRGRTLRHFLQGGALKQGCPRSIPRRGRGSRFACVISFAALLLPEEAYGLSVSSRSRGRKDEEFKKEITKKNYIS